MEDYPDITRNNEYVVSRLDGLVLDAKNYDWVSPDGEVEIGMLTCYGDCLYSFFTMVYIDWHIFAFCLVFKTNYV